MSLHITRFLDRVRAAESKQQREVMLTLNEARDLHADITRLLLALDAARDQLAKSAEVTAVEFNGGTF